MYRMELWCCSELLSLVCVHFIPINDAISTKQRNVNLSVLLKHRKIRVYGSAHLQSGLGTSSTAVISVMGVSLYHQHLFHWSPTAMTRSLCKHRGEKRGSLACKQWLYRQNGYALCSLKLNKGGFIESFCEGCIEKLAEYSGRAVWGMNCLCSLERWARGFEYHSRHGCLYCVRLFCVCVVLCVGRGLATRWSPVQGVLPTVYRIKKLKKAVKTQERAVEP
jgi:hypothetical protein